MTDDELQEFVRRTDREHDIRSFVSGGGLLLIVLVGVTALCAWWLL